MLLLSFAHRLNLCCLCSVALSLQLMCCVCFEMPSEEVYQCSNSHLLCKDCHKRVMDESRGVCPTCRQKLSKSAKTQHGEEWLGRPCGPHRPCCVWSHLVCRSKPIRNRVAEKFIKNRMVACEHSDCRELVKFSKLKEHVEKECGHRIVACDYANIGCVWSDVANDLEQHHRKSVALQRRQRRAVRALGADRSTSVLPISCKIGSHPAADDILRFVTHEKESAERRIRAAESVNQPTIQLARLLSKKCHHMVRSKSNALRGNDCA
jgi:hypothetical protein